MGKLLDIITEKLNEGFFKPMDIKSAKALLKSNGYNEKTDYIIDGNKIYANSIEIAFDITDDVVGKAEVTIDDLGKKVNGKKVYELTLMVKK